MVSHDTVEVGKVLIIRRLCQLLGSFQILCSSYRNERFFRECYKAYKEGRAESDPTTSWYKGEMGFFDFYIIPLAKKLKECGVFGVSSDEYLNYALKNRKEWELRGKEVVHEMVEAIQSEYADAESAGCPELAEA